MARAATRSDGQPPPSIALLDGEPVDLEPLAVEAAARHLMRCPEELDRYGTQAGCVREMQHVLARAFGGHAEPPGRSDGVAGGPPGSWEGHATAAEVVEERVPGGEAVAALLRGAVP